MVTFRGAAVSTFRGRESAARAMGGGGDVNRLMIVLLGLAGWLVAGQQAQAGPTVRILDTWPAGPEVVLASNRSFHLRLAYDSGEPVRIWVRAFHRGKEVPVGTSPSRQWSGRGEMMAWFFFMEPGGEVDEIRIIAGDGSRAGTQVVSTWRGRVVAGGTAAAAGAAEPRWVAGMREQERLARQREVEERMAEPASAGDLAFARAFVVGALALGLAGIVAPLWTLRRWRGGWRVAAMLPLAGMGLVLLRIVVETAIDPTSHNLWPFEIAIAGVVAGSAMLVLAMARRLSGASQP